MKEYTLVGKRVPRTDSLLKATGQAIYAGDIFLPGMLSGKILASPHAHAKIVNIDTSRAERLPGVKAVVTGKDTLGIKYGILPQSRDEDLIAREKVRFVGEAVAAVAAIDEYAAEEALTLIKVEYEILPAVFDPEEAMKEGAPQIHSHAPRNISSNPKSNYGDVEKGFTESDLVMENRFRTQPITMCSTETYSVVARCDISGRVEIWAPNQSPYTRRAALARVLDMELNQIGVRKITIGGAFGGRSEVYSPDVCAILLSRKSGKPVKIVYNRKQEFLTSRHRHPFIMDLKTGMKKDGTLRAFQLKIIGDTGAYNGTGHMTLTFPSVSMFSIYRVQDVKYEGFCVYTNNPVRNAIRGHTLIQTSFALDSQMEMMAEELGLDPIEVRLKNAIRDNTTLPNGSYIATSGLSEAIKKTVGESGWKAKKGKLPPYRGIGFGAAVCFSGFGMGIRTVSAATVKCNEDGSIVVYSGVVDNGQGNDSAMIQIAAEELGVRMEDITLVSGDSDAAPQDQGSYAQAVVSISGNAVRNAAVDARNQLFEIVTDKLECNSEDLEAKGRMIFVRGQPDKGMGISEAVRLGLSKGKVVLGRGSYDPKLAKIDWTHGGNAGQMSVSFTYGTVAVEVEVDPVTGKVALANTIVTAHDGGYPINPMAVEGQYEGGISWGIGQTLYEEDRMDNKGNIVNNSFRDYKLPSALDVPSVKSIIIETFDPKGPYGAKENTGQSNQAAVPAAIASAIYEAIGVRFKTLPITPEMILNALNKKQGFAEKN